MSDLSTDRTSLSETSLYSREVVQSIKKLQTEQYIFRYFSPVAAQKLYAAALVALLSSSAYEAEAQVGEPFIHDPFYHCPV